MLEQFDYKWALAGTAAFISICNLLYYISTVIKGKTKPHMYTWLIWGIVSITVALGQSVDNAGAGMALTVVASINCLLIASIAFFKGSINITKSDQACLIICFIGIALWPITKIPLLSVIIVTLVDLVGYIPTIRKSYNRPHEENLLTFGIFIITVTLSLFALENYSPLTSLYFIAMNIANLSLVLFLLIRRYQLGYKILA